MSDKALREELFDTIHDKRVVLTWLEWENAVTEALLEVVQRRVEEAKLGVPQYVFKYQVQEWDDTTHPAQRIGHLKLITVIAATQDGAWAEAEKVLGSAGPAWAGSVWGHSLVSATDVRA